MSRNGPMWDMIFEPVPDEATIRANERAKVAEEIATAVLNHYELDTTALPNARRDLIRTIAQHAAHIARRIGSES